MRVGHFPLNALERLLCLGTQSWCGQGWGAFKSPMVLSVGPVDGVGVVLRTLPLQNLVLRLNPCTACIEGEGMLIPGPLDQSMAQAL